MSKAARTLEGDDRDSLLGCHMGVMNFIFGGFRGKSSGKDKRALKKPPSLHDMSEDCILDYPQTEVDSLYGVRRATRTRNR